MTDNSERRESIRIPMRFQVCSTNSDWQSFNGDLSISGVRLDAISPYRFAPITELRMQLPDELKPRQVSVLIKRYFTSDLQVHAAATFDDLELEAELAIARVIDAYQG